VQQEVSSLFQTAGLTLRKWSSNHSTFLDTIPRELQETQQTLSLDNEDAVVTLGLLWNPRNVQLQVKNNFTQGQITDSTASTKRKVLATTASIFDPLRLLSTPVIVYRIFLQRLWQDKLHGMNYFLFTCNKNGISCFRLFLFYHNSRSKERLFAPMLPTFKFMDSATAVNKLMEPVCTFAPQATTTKHVVNFCVLYQRLHH
jgi:hypothetical protein